MKRSILSEVVERAARLELGGPEAGLRAAFERGLEVLDWSPASDVVDVEDSALDRARFDLLRQRALVLRERRRRLEEAVEELAGESLELHDRLWAGHEHSSRMKVRLGRRRAVTVRPEAPLTVGGSGRRRAERAERLLAGLAVVEIELDLPAGSRERVETLAERQGWADERFDDAVEVVVIHGLAALERERPPPNGKGDGEPASGPALEALAFRIFELSESLRILQIRENALRIDNRGMRLRLGQLEQEIGALEEEVRAADERGGGDARSGPARFLARFRRRKG